MASMTDNKSNQVKIAVESALHSQLGADEDHSSNGGYWVSI